jgi:hypothetical protein
VRTSASEDIREDLHLFAYFLEQARETRRINRRFFDNRKEGVHKAVFEELKNSQGVK